MHKASEVFRLIVRTPLLVVFTLGLIVIVLGLVIGGADFPRTGYTLFVAGAILAALSVLQLRSKMR